MKKFALAEIAQVAEIVASLGVVISLIYVAAELRSNTAAVKAATVQSITNSSRDVLVTVAANEGLARIRQIGEADPSALTDAEAFRFFQFSRQNWLYFQNIWIQWDLGVVDDRAWSSFDRIICGIYSRPGNRKEWPEHAAALDAQFVKVVESCDLEADR